MSPIKKTLFLSIDKGLALGLQFVGVMFIARALSVSSFGILNATMSVFAMTSFIGALGATAWFQSKVVDYSGFALRQRELLANLVVLRLLFTVLQLLVASAVLLGGGGGSPLVLIVSFFVYHLLQRFDVLDFYFLENGGISWSVLANVLGKLVFVFYAYLCMVNDWDLGVVSIGFALDFAVAYGIKYIVFVRGQKDYFCVRKFSNLELSSQLNELKYLALASASTPILLQSDVFIVNLVVGKYEAGVYSAASKLLTPFFTAAMVISLAFFANIKLYGYKYLLKLSVVVFCMMSFFSYLVFYLSDFLISVAFGNDFSSSVIFLRVLIWSLPAFSLGPIFSRAMISMGLSKEEAVKNWLVAIIFVILTFLSVKSYGPIGAAWSLVFCGYLLAVLSIVLINMGGWKRQAKL